MARLGRAFRKAPVTLARPRLVSTPFTFEELFEGGADEADITNANTGFTSIVGTNANNTLKFDTAHAKEGTRAMRLQTDPTTAAAIYAELVHTPLTTVYGRHYFYFDSAGTPEMDTTISPRGRDNANAQTWRLHGDTDHSVYIFNFNSTTRVFQSDGRAPHNVTWFVPNDQWVRFEWKYEAKSGTDGTVTLRVYENANAAIGAETFEIVTTAANLGTEQARVRYGLANADTDKRYWIDGIGLSSAGWLGPIAGGPQTFPQLAATGATFTVVGSKLTSTPRALGATLTAAAAKTTSTARALGATMTIAVARSAGKLIASTATYTSAVTRSTGKAIARTATFTVTRTAATTFGKLVALGTTLTAAAARSTGKLIAQTLTNTVAVSRSTGHAVSRAVTYTVAVTALKAFQKLVAVSATFTTAVVRSAGHATALALATALAVVRQVGHAVPLSALLDPDKKRRTITSRAITMTATVAVTAQKAFQKAVALGTTLTPTVSKITGKLVANSATFSATVLRSTSKMTQIAASLAVEIVKQTRQKINKASTMTASVAKRTGKGIAAGLVAVVARLASFIPGFLDDGIDHDFYFGPLVTRWTFELAAPGWSAGEPMVVPRLELTAAPRWSFGSMTSTWEAE